MNDCGWHRLANGSHCVAPGSYLQSRSIVQLLVHGFGMVGVNRLSCFPSTEPAYSMSVSSPVAMSSFVGFKKSLNATHFRSGEIAIRLGVELPFPVSPS